MQTRLRGLILMCFTPMAIIVALPLMIAAVIIVFASWICMGQMDDSLIAFRDVSLSIGKELLRPWKMFIRGEE